MVIRETDSITVNLTKKILDTKQNITLNEIKNRDIPNFIKNYFDRESEKWIREESSMFLSSGRFNYDLPEVRKKFDELYEVLKNTAIFNRARLIRILEQGVKLQTNFLIQPERTMLQFVYRDDDVITPAEVIDSMKYFVDYEYYYKGLEQYFQSNTMESISRAKFKNFIQQLDEKAIGQNKTSTAINVAKVIVGFLNLGREKQSSLVEPDVLVGAYQDRNLNEYTAAIKNLISKKLEPIDINQLERIFKSYLEGGEAEVKPVAEDFIKTEDLTKRLTPAVETKTTHVAYEEKKEVVSTDNLSSLISEIEDFVEEPVEQSVDSFFEEEEDDIELQAPPAPVVKEVKPPVKEEKQPVKEEKKPVKEEKKPAEVPVESAEKVPSVSDLFADHMAKQMGQASVLEDIYKIIEDRDKKVYIKKLFKKKDKEFFELLNSINAAKSWKDANTIIEDTFYNMEVNPYQKEAISFTDAAYGRYFPKEK
jgi:hypothetical protein